MEQGYLPSVLSEVICGTTFIERPSHCDQLGHRMSSANTPKAIVVHAGARDSYQVAQSLLEVGLLDQLVTNVYWSSWAKQRYGAEIPSKYVRMCLTAFLHYWVKKLMPSWKLERASDHRLGRRAGILALRHKSALVAYSYYASSAFRSAGPEGVKRILFQLHPHPRSVRKLLQEELELVPAARDSLLQEAELSLTESELEELASEPLLADAIVVASSFTLRTLVENGCGMRPTRVIPYGVDRSRFPVREQASVKGPLRVIWVGQICQRKGLSYLLDAARKLSPEKVQVVLRGYGKVDWKLLKCYGDVAIDVQQGLPHDLLLRDLHSSDIFALPSLVEGFGHSILEAMSTGLPVITTSHTCGADIVTPGVDGFLVPIRDSDAIANALEWALSNRPQLAEMGREASTKAAAYTWSTFRMRIEQAYVSFVGGTQ
uniref:Glycosyl transferase, group 1 n=1 Tax=Solibacter usitatus (strain Ellin6076) TaxID=234267 RepID=Q01XK5_SOLUE